LFSSLKIALSRLKCTSTAKKREDKGSINFFWQLGFAFAVKKLYLCNINYKKNERE